MLEDFLHYCWRMRRLDLRDMQTTEGEPITLIYPGTLNTDAGPDFFNIKVQIRDTLWAGNMEMHIHASDWYAHKHDQDLAYNNVVLHVVYQEDKPIYRRNGERIPCLELKNRIPLGIAAAYQRLIAQEDWIPCASQFQVSSDITRRLWLDRLMIERLEMKCQRLTEDLGKNNGNWEALFYQKLLRHFGGKINNNAFETLARILPLTLLRKYKNQLFQVEALLFGQAGLLDKPFKEDYPSRLRKEYLHLAHKHQLQPMNPAGWKFARTRPSNFPTIRIAQIARLIHQTDHLFSKALAAKNITELEAIFDLSISHYWKNHYRFDKTSIQRDKRLGKVLIHSIAINTIIPMLFFYGRQKGRDRYEERAVQILEMIPAESNTIISAWEALGMPAESAYHTQALLQLKKYHCDLQTCLNCPIGAAILNKKSDEVQEVEITYALQLFQRFDNHLLTLPSQCSLSTVDVV